MIIVMSPMKVGMCFWISHVTMIIDGAALIVVCLVRASLRGRTAIIVSLDRA